MKAAIIHDFNLTPTYGDIDTPIAEPGESLIQVTAAALSQLVKAQAAGKHYSSSKVLPCVPGVDGVGLLNGKRVYFAFPRTIYGAMAQYCPVPSVNCVEIPDEVDDITAAAIANPGMSSWAALLDRAKFVAGETVLINGAAGTSGRLAIQIARHLGAGKIIATARNAASVAPLAALGADVLIPLDMPTDELTATFHDAIHHHRINIVLDYLWGPSAECFLHAASGHSSREAEPRIRYVQIGSISGHVINFPGGVLRSSGLELTGSGLGSVSNVGLVTAIGEVLQAVHRAGLTIDTITEPLSNVESAWNRACNERLVFTL
jgi:NADPH:quinone reductase-like Zn-dependent oxidoreductase